MNDEDMDTYVFAVGTRKALVRLQKEMQDLVCVHLGITDMINDRVENPVLKVVYFLENS